MKIRRSILLSGVATVVVVPGLLAVMTGRTPVPWHGPRILLAGDQASFVRDVSQKWDQETANRLAAQPYLEYQAALDRYEASLPGDRRRAEWMDRMAGWAAMIDAPHVETVHQRILRDFTGTEKVQRLRELASQSFVQAPETTLVILRGLPAGDERFWLASEALPELRGRWLAAMLSEIPGWFDGDDLEQTADVMKEDGLKLHLGAGDLREIAARTGNAKWKAALLDVAATKER